jgi:hypothetical protein
LKNISLLWSVIPLLAIPCLICTRNLYTMRDSSIKFIKKDLLHPLSMNLLGSFVTIRLIILYTRGILWI